MNSTRFSLRGLLVALAIVALGLPVALAGLFGVLQQLTSINLDVARVRNAQLDGANLARFQVDEETAIRGYAVSHGSDFLEPYQQTMTQLPTTAAELRGWLTFGPGDAAAIARLDDAVATNAHWRTTFAEPTIKGRKTNNQNQVAMADVDRFRTDLTEIGAIILVDYHALIARRTATIKAASTIGYVSIAVTGAEFLVFAILFARLRYALDRERNVTEALQHAFAGAVTNDPRLDTATVYLSATRGAKIGGDVYDVYHIDEDRTLVIIADVSGKGVDAAVDTTFVKYSLRAFSSEYRDVATIVGRFNTLYADAQKPPESFVVLFTGIYDRSDGTLTYVNAGHEAAYVRRTSSVEQLTVTDQIIGLARDVEFHTKRVALGTTDTLFLATDGLTEARDPSGAFLGEENVRQWLVEAQNASARALVSEISDRLRRYTRANINDDLAILAIRPDIL